MTDRTRAAVVALSFVGAMQGACVRQVGTLTFLTTRNIDYASEQIDLGSARHMEGESCRWLFVHVPLGAPSIGEAFEHAVAGGKGSAMINAALFQSYWWALGTGQWCLSVKGDVVDTTAAKP